MRTLAAVFVSASLGLAQNFTIPESVQFPGDCILSPGGSLPDPVEFEIKSDAESFPFTAATHPNGWVAVAPTAGIVGPSVTKLTLTIRSFKIKKGTQRSHVAITIAGKTHLVTAVLVCVPGATLNTSVSELTFSLLQGGPAQSKSFLVTPNTAVFQPEPDNPLLFEITWDTPQGLPWVGFAGTTENGKGKIENSNGVTVHVGVNPQFLPVGRTTGYMHISDLAAGGFEGTDSVLIIVDVATSPNPVIAQNGVSDAAAGRLVLAPGSWASAYGTQLAPDTVAEGRSWQSSEFVNGRLPTALDEVSVTIGSKAAAVAYVSNSQVNFLVPTDVVPGSTVPLFIKTSNGTSPTVITNVQEYAPNLFTYQADGKRYVAAQHTNYSAVTSESPARPGETILIYATGFGPTNPTTPPGVLVGGGAAVVAPVAVRIGGIAATAVAYLSGVGLYQLNITVPENLLNGDQPIIATVSGIETQTAVVLTVRR
jgi:uncharacterized protein (TIGR03437 family)